MIYNYEEKRKMKTGEEFTNDLLLQFIDLCGDYIAVCQRRLAPDSYNDEIEDRYYKYMAKGREYFDKIKDLCDEMITAIEEEKERR